MEILFQLILLLVGLVLLWKMGEFSVRSALGFSAIYGVHQFTVGFLIFAISTGLPEISSAVVSSINKVSELSVGTLMGSSFVNMSLILGIIAFVAREIEISPLLRKRLFKVVAMIIVILVFCMIVQVGSLYKGILLIALYVGSIFWFQAGIPKGEASEEIHEIEEEVEKVEKKAFLSPKVDISLKLFGSLALLLIASWVTVHAATKLSAQMNIDLALLGGTLIAVGTSFPELVLEIHAIKKKEYALALGDLFGSSLLNISLILGMLMLMNKQVDLSYVWQILPFIGAVLIWVLQGLFRKKGITRVDGILFLAIFACYVGWSLYSHFSVVR